ncbi:ABC transporter substrate-binding protein [Parenemella sanctibonifatiensis]|uniref:ABC transporter substrate-binding protein n=1 Tax=Parenemella sanctibonifatiensis TaxID=2016505 RepID=A0A255ELI7_9ACTN|nr:extracellular solute-binding protein [Parenemella sanctibonifatiensis]OYN90322.1 ABC transporter substrate-binding protein [Parenemella sanctibonifatiensis]
MHRRTLLSAGLAASALAAVTACSGGGSGGGGSAETPSELTTIDFFTDKAAWEPSFEEMNQTSTSINVELKFTGYSDPTAYDSFIKQAFRTRDVPDLFTWHTGGQLAELVEQNLVAETTDLWTEATSNNLVPEGLIDNYTHDGAQYGVPLNVAYWAMYYNKPIFEEHGLEVPTSWDELMANCDTLMTAGITPFHQMNIIFEFVWFQLLLMGQSPETYEALQTGEASYTDPEVVTAAREWGRMIDEGYFVDPGVQTDPQTLLNTGEVAMAYLGTFFTGQLASIGAVSGTDYGIFVPPNLNPATSDPQMVIETGPLVAGSGSENEAEVLAYSSWWFSDEAQNAWSTARGDVSFNPNVSIADPELSALSDAVNDPATVAQKRYLEATPLPIYTRSTEVFGKFVTDGGDPMPMLEQLQTVADDYWAEQG